MKLLEQFYHSLISLLPTAAVLALVIIVIYVVRLMFARKYEEIPGRRFRAQVVIMILSFAGLLAVVLTLPIGDTRQGQLLSLIGILLSAAIALSATTFVGNMMAGVMIRSLRNFRPGDFIRVGEWFGRVSERGLFHVEIQTEDRDLTTLPNLYLVTNPVKVVRSSGTIISAEVSLGYDIPHPTVSELLIKAARAAQLQDPFVHVIQLGDFSVTYRVSGLLVDVKQLLTARSQLHEKMLDFLHRNNIEIVSPTFMNTRALQKGDIFIPRVKHDAGDEKAGKSKPVAEALVFDKAEEAESLEKIRERYEALGKELDAAKEQRKDAVSDAEKEEIEARIGRLEASRDRLAEVIKSAEEEADKE